MKQRFFDNVQKNDNIVTCGNTEEVFYPHYISPLGIKRFTGSVRLLLVRTSSIQRRSKFMNGCAFITWSI